LTKFIKCPTRTKQVAHSVAEQDPVNRFGDEVSCPDLIGLMDRTFVLQASEHDNRNVFSSRHLTQRRTGLVAVEFGHHHIQEYQIRGKLLEHFQRLTSVFCLFDKKACVFECLANEQADSHTIVDDKYEGVTAVIERVGHRSILLKEASWMRRGYGHILFRSS